MRSRLCLYFVLIFWWLYFGDCIYSCTKHTSVCLSLHNSNIHIISKSEPLFFFWVLIFGGYGLIICIMHYAASSSDSIISFFWWIPLNTLQKFEAWNAKRSSQTFWVWFPQSVAVNESSSNGWFLFFIF